MDEIKLQVKTARKTFSWVGLSLFVCLMIAVAASAAWTFLPEMLLGKDHPLLSSSGWFWLSSIVPMYLVALPLGLLLLKVKPGYVPVRQKLGGVNFLISLCICFFLMYCGSIIGNLLSFLLSGGTAENPISEAVMDGHILKYVAILVCAPVLEELVFRKFILDRTRHFGEVNALFLSAVCFGLFHMNFYQFFYAFGIGLVFGYVYLRTGRARYSMIMHAIINFFGGVLAPWVLSLMQDMPADAPMDLDMVMETIGPVLLTLAFSFLIMAAFVAGLVLLILNARKLHWFRYPQELPRGRRFSVPYINVGMILFVLLCGVFMVLNLL